MSTVVALTGASVAGSVLIGILLHWPRWCAPIAMGMLFSNISVLLVEIHGGPTVLIVMPYVIVLISAIYMLFVQRLPLVWGPVMTAVVAFATAATLSTVFSPRASLTVTTLIEWMLEGVIFFFAAVNSIRGRRDLRAAVMAVCLAAIVVAIFVARQYRQSNYYDIFWGFAQVTDPYDLTGASNVLADGTEPGQYRSAGMIGEPNFFASAMLTVLPWLIYLAVTASRRWRKVGWGVGAGLVLLAVVVSYSRGALVALALVALLLAVIGVLPRRMLLFMAAGGAAALVLVPTLAARLGTLTSLASSGAGTEASASGRLSEILAAGQVFLTYPVTGVGPGQFPEYYQQFVGLQGVGVHFGEGPRNAHNLIAGLAADTGVLGLLSFVALIGVVLTGLWRARRTELRLEASAALASVLLYLAAGLFLHLAYARYLWLVLVLATVVLTLADRRGRLERAG